MSRSTAREVVFKLIFEYIFNLEADNDQLTDFLLENKDEQDYIQEAYHGIIENYNELCSIVRDNAVGFAFNRIFKVDLAILLVALYEIKYMDSIPAKVSINEALNLAKTYSTEKSNKFINGILASVVK